MTIVSGKYFNGQITLDKFPVTDKTFSVSISFLEEPFSSLRLEAFGFLESQELLKNYKAPSFADEVIKERRSSLLTILL